MPTLDLIAGARPNFMKIAPIIHAIESREKSTNQLHYRLIHTGQHYDKALSGNFFEELGLPEPAINLGVGSGTQAEQTANIMLGYEKVISKGKPDLCLVVGDVTSTMAAAIVAQKSGIPVAHVEGGIRSDDWSMPEEINRRVTDAISNYFFTTSVLAGENLKRAGVESEQIYFVGNTMIDSLLANRPRFSPPAFWDKLKLDQKGYIVLTLHRPSNVDDQARFIDTLQTIAGLSQNLPVIYPAHPRTLASLSSVKLPSNLYLVEPQPYLAFNFLVENAFAVITDSGGITEETTVLGIPCMTLRDSTERPETITEGTNELVGSDPHKLKPYLAKLFAGNWKQGTIPDKWEGHAAERIVTVLEQILCQ